MARILLLSVNFPPPDGGAQRRYANLCRSFPPGSIEVGTSRREGAEAFDSGQSYPVHRVPVEPGAERGPVGYARWMAWTLSRLRLGDVGVMWIGDLRPMGRMVWLAKRVTGVSYGISFHGDELNRGEKRSWKRGLASRIFDEASFLLANSAHIARCAVEYARRIGARPPGGRLRIVPSGADLERFRTDHDRARARAAFGLGEGTLVLTVSRLIPQKGLDGALRSFSLAVGDRTDVRYAVAGAGPFESELRALAGELGIAERVRFLGPVPYERMPLLHAAADVHLLTSLETPGWVENFPNAVLEAMATGVPVVAGRVGGVPEMVADGETGFLVDPEHPAAIAAALERLLDDPGLRRAMGAAGRARAERELDHERAAREIYAVFAESSRLPLPPWSPGARRPEAAGRAGPRQAVPA